MAINMTASMVAGFFGQQGQSSFLSPFGNAPRAASAGEAVAAFRRVTKAGEEAKGVAREKKDPITLTTIAQFRQALGEARTLDKALGDPRVLKVLMPALGLPDQINNFGLVKRALLSDPKDPKSIASQLGTAWKNAASTLNLKALTTPKTVAIPGITDEQSTMVAAQLRFGENILTAPQTRSAAPRMTAFDGLPDSLTRALASQLRPGENATPERAKLEVDYAAVMTAVTLRTAENPADNLPDIAKASLQQMASFVRSGDFSIASSFIDDKLRSLENGGGLPADQLKRTRVALIEAGITVDQLRRDADAVAKRVEDLVRLDMPAGVSWSPVTEMAYQDRLKAFQREGVDKKVNFPLEVAASMGRRMLMEADEESTRSLAQSLIDGAQKILDERGGKPTVPSGGSASSTRISVGDVNAILDAMKNVTPPNLPRAQLEVIYGAGALRSALDRAGTPPFGLPAAAFSAFKAVEGLAKTGAFGAALDRIDLTLEEMAKDATLPAQMLRDGSAALLELGMSLEMVTRNANGYAERAERRAALDQREKSTWSRGFQERIETFHRDGMDGNVNFALEIATAMASRMIGQANTPDEGTLAQSLFNRSQQELRMRDGRAAVSSSAGGSQPRIAFFEASKIIQSMKSVSPLGSLGDPKMLDVLVNGFIKYEYLRDLSTANPGMSDAIYFMEKAKTVKSPYDILGNTAMRRVVLGALGLPDQVAIQPVETQARAITSRIKLTDLQDANKVRAIAERFLMARAEKAAEEQANTSTDAFSVISKLSITA